MSGARVPYAAGEKQGDDSGLESRVSRASMSCCLKWYFNVKWVER